MKRILALSLCFFSCALIAKSKGDLFFVDVNLEDFMTRVINEPVHKKQFTSYYQRLTQKIKSSDDDNDRRAFDSYLQQAGLDALKREQPAWYKNLKPYVSNATFTLDSKYDNVRQGIGLFLKRYGAYKEFRIRLAEQNRSPEDQAGLWDQVTGYARKATTKVTHWFGAVKNRITA